MEVVSRVYEAQILPLLSKLSESQAHAVVRKNKALSIGAAVILTMVYVAYSRVAKPPKKLRHIPTANNIKLLRAYLSGWPINEISSKITIPAALKSAHDIYVRYDINGWMVRIQDPAAAKKVLLKTDLFPKYSLKPLREGTIFGEFFAKPNLVTVSGDQWKSHRKIANPAFHRSMPVELFGNLTNKVFKLVDKLGGTVDFVDLMTRFTLDAIGLAGFGFDFHAIENPQSTWVVIYNSINEAMWKPLFAVFPTLEQRFLWAFPERQKRHQDLRKFMNMLDEVIAHKRKILKEEYDASSASKPENEKDLLTLMIESENKGEGALSNEELKSNLCIFFLAGHDTTANALSFAVYYLAANPDIQKRAREEALSVLGDGTDDILPTVEQSKNMPYINCIIKEALRMNPPASAVLPRYAAEDTVLNGVFIPKGAKISIDIHEMHHSPRIWKDPEVFNPDRFMEGGDAESLAGSGMSWLPFSNGARQCIGMNFSLAEQRVFLPLLLRRYEWSLPEDSIHKDHVVTTGLGIITAKNLKIAFKKRH